MNQLTFDELTQLYFLLKQTDERLVKEIDERELKAVDAIATDAKRRRLLISLHKDSRKLYKGIAKKVRMQYEAMPDYKPPSAADSDTNWIYWGNLSAWEDEV